MERKDFINVKRIVIKLGTNILRNAEGEVALSRIYSFIEDISKLVKEGKEIIVVTTAAQACFTPSPSVDSRLSFFLPKPTAPLVTTIISLPSFTSLEISSINE